MAISSCATFVWDAEKGIESVHQQGVWPCADMGPYGCAAVTTVEGPPAPSPPQVSFSFKSAFVKRMQANFRLTMKPSAGPGNAMIGASSGLGRGL